jgi:hypothetical protein
LLALLLILINGTGQAEPAATAEPRIKGSSRPFPINRPRWGRGRTRLLRNHKSFSLLLFLLYHKFAVATHSHYCRTMIAEGGQRHIFCFFV